MLQPKALSKSFTICSKVPNKRHKKITTNKLELTKEHHTLFSFGYLTLGDTSVECWLVIHEELRDDFYS